MKKSFLIVIMIISIIFNSIVIANPVVIGDYGFSVFSLIRKHWFLSLGIGVFLTILMVIYIFKTVKKALDVEKYPENYKRYKTIMIIIIIIVTLSFLSLGYQAYRDYRWKFNMSEDIFSTTL